MTATITTGQDPTVTDKPPYRGTRLHALRIPDPVWDGSLARAREDSTSVNAEVVAFLRAWAAGDAYTLPARPKPRRRAKPPA